ncbi:MAG: AraC family transcriptional regulator [Spirosomataceae bacterium]
MTIYLDYYSTPLWFGFVQAWIFAVLFWIRGRQSGRLSDLLLGFVMVEMSFSIWEYMLGFSGINVLWEELEFLPRDFGLGSAPLIYFTFRSLTDSTFRFAKKDIWHFAPFLIDTLYHVLVYAMGSDFVEHWKTTVHHRFYIFHVEFVVGVAMYIYYFYRSLKLYQAYRRWAVNQFSDTDQVSYRWFRNFLVVVALSLLSQWTQAIVSLLFDLNFYENWWDKLLAVVLIYYVSIMAYAQVQPSRGMVFNIEEPRQVSQQVSENKEETRVWQEKLRKLMEEEKLYLQPELSLSDIALRLKTNISTLSGVVNGAFGKNFNDFVNEYRVKEFQERMNLPENRNLTLLGIAYDCGFNSKATFNRAFKKHTGKSPKEFLLSEVEVA